MPIYENKCNSCGNHQDIYRSIAERNNDMPVCCNQEMQRVISAPMIMGDIEPYQAMAIDKQTGEMPFITSRIKHKEFLKNNGYVEIGNEIKEPKQRTEVLGDFNMKQDIAEATKKALANPKNYY